MIYNLESESKSDPIESRMRYSELSLAHTHCAALELTLAPRPLHFEHIIERRRDCRHLREGTHPGKHAWGNGVWHRKWVVRFSRKYCLFDLNTHLRAVALLRRGFLRIRIHLSGRREPRIRHSRTEPQLSDGDANDTIGDGGLANNIAARVRRGDVRHGTHRADDRILELGDGCVGIVD